MKKLTQVEENIMHLIWDCDSCTVSQLIDKMPEPKPPHSSISSIVRILEKKEFVNHKAYGRTHVYFAVVEKEDYSKSNIKSFVKNYFEGSMESMVSFLVNEKEIDTKELKDLIKKLENNKS